MRRMELFEIHDQPRFPALLRDLVTDALQSLWDFSNSYRPVLLLLRDALAKAGTRDVLDLCSGAGGPWFGLVREFDSEHHFPIHVRLTDKYPNRKAFEKVPASQMSMVEFDLRPVDATEVPIDLRGFRTMFSSFHHFGRVEARRVLANAVESGKGLAIFEMARREARIMLAVCFIPFLVWFLTPRIRPFRWSRLVWTYFVPIVPFVVWFDGWMSCLRSYSQDELRELMLSVPAESYRWELGSQCDGLLPVTYMIGYPVSSTKI
jgi:hypothetical protein